MQKIQDYFTINGWKTDAKETLTDMKDIGILVRRTLGLSHYGYKNGGEMTSREIKDSSLRASSLWFNNEQEFLVYAMTHTWPLGRCIIGSGKTERVFDDTVVERIPKTFYPNNLTYLKI